MFGEGAGPRSALGIAKVRMMYFRVIESGSAVLGARWTRRIPTEARLGVGRRRMSRCLVPVSLSVNSTSRTNGLRCAFISLRVICSDASRPSDFARSFPMPHLLWSPAPYLTVPSSCTSPSR